jgi:TetR/AcrR family transcriptional repressor of mexJK operon
MATPAATPTRTDRKRDAILTAATAVFLRSGFRGTTMDDIAARAHVSKQTVYKQFTDKERLFREIVDGMVGASDSIMGALTAAYGPEQPTTLADLEGRLTQVARTFLDGVLRPEVLALRRLVIAEADQFPDLARAYYESGPTRGIATVRGLLEPVIRSGLLAGDPATIAAQFAYLAVGVAQDRTLFHPADPPGSAVRYRLAAAAARTIVAAHGGASA